MAGLRLWPKIPHDKSIPTFLKGGSVSVSSNQKQFSELIFEGGAFEQLMFLLYTDTGPPMAPEET